LYRFELTMEKESKKTSRTKKKDKNHRLNFDTIRVRSY
jgi:hypothetical protein